LTRSATWTKAAYRRLLAWACDLPYKDATYAFGGFRLDFVRGLARDVRPQTWMRPGPIAELKAREGRRIAGESKVSVLRAGGGLRPRRARGVSRCASQRVSAERQLAGAGAGKWPLKAATR
jgi:hypothetical protein